MIKTFFNGLLHKPIAALSKHQQRMGFVFLVACHTLTKAWCQQFLHLAELKHQLTGTHKKLTCILNDTQAQFLKVWEPWLTHNADWHLNRWLLSTTGHWQDSHCRYMVVSCSTLPSPPCLLFYLSSSFFFLFLFLLTFCGLFYFYFLLSFFVLGSYGL